MRVPPHTRRLLKALCARKKLPAWLVMRLLVLCFVRNLPARERRWVMARAKQAA
jgi:hypothetical protein